VTISPFRRVEDAVIGFLRKVTRWVITSYFRVFYALRIENQPDWRRSGPVILAPNHVSFADPLFVQAAWPRHLTFLMTEAIWKLKAINWFFRFWGAIPVPDGEAVKATSIKEALKAIRAGKPVVIFPEGKISVDGKLNAGSPGVAALMGRARVPVIPMAILGSYDVLPDRANFPRIAKVTVRFGAPISPPEGDLDREGLRRFAAQVMDAIAALGAPRR
jgi:1-acyl-sn-glycerol-3-phosphate acyltransferase